MSNIGYVHTLIFAYIEIIDKIEWMTGKTTEKWTGDDDKYCRRAW